MITTQSQFDLDKAFHNAVLYLESFISSTPKEFLIPHRNKTANSEANDIGGGIGIERLAHFLNRIGNPQRDLKYVHLTGTSGKGSTAHFLSHILKNADLTVGLHTSPHLIDIRERLIINGEVISKADFVELVSELKPHIDEDYRSSPFGVLSYFEVILALSFCYFKKNKVDIVVLEAGLGGTYDGTNVIDQSLISVITTIDLDHTEFLGETFEAIARDKSGIIRQNQLVITGETKSEAVSVIQHKADSLFSRLFRYKHEFDYHITAIKNHLIHFDYWLKADSEEVHLKDLKLSVLAEYQLFNATLALTIAMLLKQKYQMTIPESALGSIENCVIPGRMEEIEGEFPIILDGAHNPEKLRALLSSLRQYYPTVQQWIFVVGFTKGKKLASCIATITDFTDTFILTRPMVTFREIAMPLEIKDHLEKSSATPIQTHIYLDPIEAYQKAKAIQREKGCGICITGSLYLVGYLKSVIQAKADQA